MRLFEYMIISRVTGTCTVRLISLDRKCEAKRPHVTEDLREGLADIERS